MNKAAIIIIQILVLTAISCAKEEIPHENLPENIKTAEVSLDLSVARATGGTADTKAIEDPDEVASTTIRNLNIFQFDGIDESAKIVGEVRYLSDEADPADEERYLNTDKIRLADSQGKKHTIVILANTFTKLPQVDNLGEMKDFLRHVEKESDVFGYNGDGLDFPDGTTTYYQRLNAIVVDVITNGTILKGALRRSMARLDISVENTGKDNLKISSIQVCNVSQKDWYISDYRYIDPETGYTKSLFEEEFKDSYDPAHPKRMDYEPVAWKGDPDGTGNADYTFYVPANQRGTDPVNLLPQEKNRCPNTDGATYVRITGEYGSSPGTPISYTFYLGGNLINDFNINPNTIYKYRFKIDGKGDAITDDRIDDMGTIDFNVDANCYILNPPKSHSRSYTFNAIHRPNIFWGPRYGMNAKYPNYTIDATKVWKARVLWSDFEMTKDQLDAFLVRKNGNGTGGYTSDAQRIKVTVPAGMKPGNVIIGMYIDNPDNILWSWHLWITDYQPDNIAKHAPIDGKYIYQVTGGEVHRYSGDSWTHENGLYRNGYAMDRNLGAYDQKQHSNECGDGLLYQFGRKDPFHGRGSIWIYDSSGNSTLAKQKATISFDSEALKPNNGSNVAYAVNNPMIAITGQEHWTIGDIFNPTEYTHDIIWQDPYNTVKTDNEENRGNSGKSLFDPCPPGWCLPEGRCAQGAHWVMHSALEHWLIDFTGDAAGEATTSAAATCQYITDPKGRGKGRAYFPGGYLANKDNPEAEIVFFPDTRDTHMHTANTSTTGRACPTEMTSLRVLHNDVPSSIRSNTYNVRCVRKDY